MQHMETKEFWRLISDDNQALEYLWNRIGERFSAPNAILTSTISWAVSESGASIANGIAGH